MARSAKPGGDSAIDDRLDADVMQQIWLEIAIERSQRQQRPQLQQGVHAVLPQRQRVKGKTAFCDSLPRRAIGTRCGNVNVEAGSARRQRQRQAMRQEKTRNVHHV